MLSSCRTASDREDGAIGSRCFAGIESHLNERNNSSDAMQGSLGPPLVINCINS